MGRFIWTHPANKGIRLQQLFRAAWFHLTARLLGRRACVPVGSRGGRLWVDLHRTAATRALYANPPDWPHMLVWERHLRPSDLFLDVGANVGIYSVLCASLGATVIAIEPASDTAMLLRENSELNGGRIQVLESAVGANAGQAYFTMGQDAVNRIDPAGQALVPVTTIDNVIGGLTVAGLKLDIEGFELHALRGAIAALRDRRIKLAQIEWNAASDRDLLASLLYNHGYRLFAPRPDGQLTPFQPTGPTGDLFAAPSTGI